MDKCYDNLHDTGKAFVIFDHQRDVRMLDDKSDRGITGKICYFCMARCCKKKTKGYPIYTFEGKYHKHKNVHINISRAPEPTDVYWENMGVSFWNRLGKTALTLLASLGAISVVFGISWAIKSYKSNIEEEYRTDQRLAKTDFNDLIEVRGLSFLTSLVVVVFNRILVFIIRALSAKERHKTYTKFNVSVGFKLTVATFANTVIIPLVVNHDQNSEWFANGGLVIDVFYNFISVSFITPFLYILDIVYLTRLIKQCL